LQQRAKELYSTALKYYKAEDFERAKVAFIDVEKTWPDYKSTQKYLARLEEDIARKERQGLGAARWSNQPVTSASILEGNGNLVVREAEQRRREEFLRQAETKYREAIALYKAQEFIEAKLKFIEVEDLSPGYKSTADYLSRIDTDIRGYQQALDQEKAQRQVEGGQKQKLPVQRGKIIQEALREVENDFQAQEPIRARSERKKQSLTDENDDDWSRDIQKRRDELRAQRSRVQKEYDEQFRQFYNKAIRLYREGSYEEAHSLFCQIEQMKPGYKSALSYIRKAEAKMGKNFQKRNNNVVMQPQGSGMCPGVVDKALNDFEQRL
ncbi:MAG TPA: hypothetical protein PKV41_01660, partial [Candidatus Omnitrophota bacterium]|nr:hypothetical protein [Candidatus Omnitrophota bacterium]